MTFFSPGFIKMPFKKKYCRYSDPALKKQGHGEKEKIA